MKKRVLRARFTEKPPVKEEVVENKSKKKGKIK